jgi:hypothetical protein
MVAAALVGCEGSLREQVGNSNVDASTLTRIPAPPCELAAAAPDDGECTGGEAPGADCLMCHHQGGDATPYSFAGTLYDAPGTTPVAGATIILQDSVGNVARTMSRSNGNFFASDFVMYPAKAFVTLCPDVLEMIGPVDEITGANCNTSGCHAAGFRIHLP